MKKEKESCPHCGSKEKQSNYGYNKSGTQRSKCKMCKKIYTSNGKTRAYSEEIRKSAIKTYYSGVSGRGVGKLYGMSKANVYNLIKKAKALTKVERASCEVYELDELYWFVERKGRSETRENTYILTMVSREPRQIVGHDVAADKSPDRVQAIVDSARDAGEYCTDGHTGYIDVVYPGRHESNARYV